MTASIPEYPQPRQPASQYPSFQQTTLLLPFVFTKKAICMRRLHPSSCLRRLFLLHMTLIKKIG